MSGGAEEPRTFPAERPEPEGLAEGDQFVLSELLNHVLDKGVVITGHVLISIADIDLVELDLRLVLSSVETALRHNIGSGPPPSGGP